MCLRINQFLGRFSVCLTPLGALVTVTIGTIPFLALTNKPEAVLLASISTYVAIMAIYLEKEWLDVTPLPPLTVLCVGGWLRSGLGGYLLAISQGVGENDENRAFFDHLPEAQLLWVCLTGATLLLFVLFPIRQVSRHDRRYSVNSKSLLRIVLGLGIFSVGLILTGVLAGTLDRAPDSYSHWVSRSLRPDLFFTMFARFRDIFFFLVPAAWNATESRKARLLLLLMTCGYLLLALPLGGRGLLLYPVVYVGFGLWFARVRASKLRIIVLVLLVICSAAVPSIEIYRRTPAFISGGEIGIYQRADAFKGAVSQMTGSKNITKIINTAGLSFYGCSDGFLFKEPAVSRPRAGFIRIGNVLTAWIPELIWKRNVPVRDAHIIANEIRGSTREVSETKQYKYFSCVTFGGDLYWRGGWAAVVLGSILAGLAYRGLARIWYSCVDTVSSWGILLLAYPVTFLSLYPFGSIGETAWLWMWDLPKYVVFLSLLSLVGNKITERAKQ